MNPHFVILGGGLSGLSSAFHLTKNLPNTLITLVDKNELLGGWVRSERITTSSSSILLESGPRTLRPNSKPLLELINLLNLKNNVITTPRSSIAAKSRFLYLPEHGLQLIPNSLTSMLSSPLRNTLLSAVLAEPFRRPNLPEGLTDESVDAFMSRRFGPKFARIFASALVHGIYATDSRQLSVRAAFPGLWDVAETKGRGSVGRGVLRPSWTLSKSLVQLQRHKEEEEREKRYEVGEEVETLMKDASVYSFKDGLQTLTNAMEAYIRAQPNVRVLESTEAKRIVVNPVDGSLEVVVVNNDNNALEERTLRPTTIISTLALPALHAVLANEPPPSSMPPPSVPSHILLANPYASVTVVNLVFPSSSSSSSSTTINNPQIHPPGFGYLIPRPESDYPSAPSLDDIQVSPPVLGTVFDSCSLSAQDTGGYTKLTVMLGGPYLTPSSSSSPSLPLSLKSIPDEALITSVLSHLSRVFYPFHSRNNSGSSSSSGLSKLPQPIAWKVTHNENCIPTLKVGHLERMDELRRVLDSPSPSSSVTTTTEMGKGWNGRLKVIGAGVGGVSVGDCVEQGRKVAFECIGMGPRA